MQIKIAEKYPDDYNRTIMLSDETTKQKNQILRKIKFYKDKQAKMPEFIRKQREDLLTQRKKEQAEAAALKEKEAEADKKK